MNRIFRDVFRITLPLLFSFSAVANTDSQPLTVKDDAPQTYVVVKGDTLWDISAMYLDSPWLWPRLWQVNPEIDNPHLIYPGDKLSLVWINGQPVLSLKPVKKLSPKARITEKKAVPTIAEGLVLPYLSSDRLVLDKDLESAAKVMGSSKGSKYLVGEDVLYISGKQDEQYWAIYRPVKTYDREDTSQSITALKVVARGNLVSSQTDFSGIKITAQLQEIERNDIALPLEQEEKSDLSVVFYPQPAPADVSAKILGNIEGMRFSSTNQVVVLDLGSKDNLRQGSMLNLMEDAHALYQNSDGYTKEGGLFDSEVVLPKSKVGELLVIRPYEYFSLALITNSTKPINKEVSVVSPLAEESTTNDTTQ
ncbi:LysM peptidoglycan-binding domain-containing protein [Vibrio rotiferianus]|uniref:LysM peptidoglycan-binding domain-containing protein n=1 Tax=Vibrio rotiferianus TaxID=190895 RepID=UPI00148C4A32|nr:LysM peptidoglycan-binding domain-containing protein [Vibrio rotiferianus]NOH69537.1 LysM peptidoglycan-binding domain-containing protein [Vibrio rotiferianus]